MKFTKAIITSLLVTIALLSVGGLVFAEDIALSPNQSVFGEVSLNTAIPLSSPSEIPLLAATTNPGDIIQYGSPDLMQEQQNVTSESDAPQAAMVVLNENGGVPNGASISYVKTVYLTGYNIQTNQTTSQTPLLTQVVYSRGINGMPVGGPGGIIDISLGGNGENLGLFKVWRTATPAGSQQVISADEALDKLRNGELIQIPQDPVNVTINNISLGYYEKGAGEQQDYFEPVWIFYANTSTGDPIDLYVYARRFANFTATPTETAMWQTVNFTDTSDTNTTQWYWDFGDGTNSTLKNPAHIYSAAGNYTVNLTAWNDLGSDTLSKPDYISVSYQKPLNTNFTAYPTNASMGETVTFTDLSNATPTQWSWDFGDGTNSTLENPTHAYTSGGYYTVNLTAGNSFGNDTLSRVNYIYIYPNAAPAAGFSSNYSWENAITPLPVAFNDASTGNVTSWYWDFGDGMNSTDQNPIHIFNASPGSLFGYYTVNLTVTDDVGRNSSSTENINVKKAIYPDFIGDPTSGTAPLNVTFTDLTPDANLALSNTWDFGDGESSQNSDQPFPTTLSHEYTSPGSYNVTLTYYVTGMARPLVATANNIIRPNSVWYSDNYATTKTFYINVNSSQPPVADFSANVTTGKEPLTVSFNDTSTGFPTSWNWTFGDSGTSSDQNPIHTYQNAGNYTVSLTVANSDGTNATTKVDYITVLLRNPPVANFTANVTTGTAPLAVAFTDNSTNNPTGWNWTFGDGDSSDQQNPAYIYSEPGNYSVNLQVTNVDGTDSLLKTDYIIVYLTSPIVTLQPAPPNGPVADFSANVTAGKTPLNVAFTDASTGFPSAWYWDFGDETNAISQDPFHSYTAAGTYNVSLTATNVYGNNTTTKSGYITVLPRNPPVANFTANVTSGQVPLGVQFTDASTNSPTSWHWDFGDGTNATTQNPVHVYTSVGQYSVSLTATNSDGSDTRTRTNYISVSTGTAGPVANFTAKPTCGKVPLSVVFNDTSTGSPTSWFWNFGDGTNATTQNPVHIYTSSGKYTVSLTASNTGGSNTITRQNYITVSGGSSKLPDADFEGKPTCGKAPLNVTFTDRSTGSPTIWYWDFGDGINATVKNPFHTYTNPGKYTVSLKVTNAAGSDTKVRQDYVSVSGSKPIVADFEGTPTWGKAPLKVTFTDLSTGSPTSWYWNFGDGTNSTRQNPVHTYATAGKYTVSLIAINTNGNSTKTRVEYISVSPGWNPTPTITPTRTCTVVPPRPCPHVSETTENGKVRLTWDRISDPQLQGYKVIISKNNPDPKYPDDGYELGTLDPDTNLSIIDPTTLYHGGDFGGQLNPGEKYYVNVVAVYNDTAMPGNVVQVTWPSPGKSMAMESVTTEQGLSNRNESDSRNP